MQLFLRDPRYTDPLMDFLASVGQRPLVAGPALVELDASRDDQTFRLELEMYLDVWRVLHPEADVELAA